MIYRQPVKSRLGIILLMTVCAFVSGLIMVWLYREVSAMYACRDWATTMGIVVHSEIKSHRETHKYENAIYYNSHIEYRYRINGVEYRGDRVYFSQYGSKNISLASNIVKRYPVGRTVEVYYDPEQPENAVLVPRPQNLKGVLAAAGLLLLTMTGFALWVRRLLSGIRRDDKTSDPQFLL